MTWSWPRHYRAVPRPPIERDRISVRATGYPSRRGYQRRLLTLRAILARRFLVADSRHDGVSDGCMPRLRLITRDACAEIGGPGVERPAAATERHAPDGCGGGMVAWSRTRNPAPAPNYIRDERRLLSSPGLSARRPPLLFTKAL